VFEKSFSVDFTTPPSEKRVRENKGFGVCDAETAATPTPPELHLRLNLTLFKHPLNKNPQETQRLIGLEYDELQILIQNAEKLHQEKQALLEKQRLHWTQPQLSSTQAAERWSDLMPLLTWQLWLAREACIDAPLLLQISP